MARDDLGKHEDDRREFTATYVRIGSKGGRTRLTVLLQDVVDVESDELVADHVWFNLTDGFAHAGLECGDAVSFRARVKLYEKGYRGKNEKKAAKRPKPSTDWKLSYPTAVRKLDEKRPVRDVEGNWEKRRGSRAKRARYEAEHAHE